MARRAWAKRLARLFGGHRPPGRSGHAGPGAGIGQKTMTLDGVDDGDPPEHRALHPADLLRRPAGGRVPAAGPGELPVGVQLVAAPWREDLCLRAARFLERAGVSRPAAPHPSLGL
jgi:hypothetical protein